MIYTNPTARIVAAYLRRHSTPMSEVETLIKATAIALSNVRIPTPLPPTIPIEEFQVEP